MRPTSSSCCMFGLIDQRIANWIKSMLGDASIDTDTFSAHSTRGATTTAAVKHGVPISQILRTADWSSEGTFREYYYTPTNDPSFAHKVLSTQSEDTT